MKTTTTHTLEGEGDGSWGLTAAFNHSDAPAHGRLAFVSWVQRRPGMRSREIEEVLDETLATLRTFLRNALDGKA